MLEGQRRQSWQELLGSLVTTLRDIGAFLIGVLQGRQGPSASQQGEVTQGGSL